MPEVSSKSSKSSNEFMIQPTEKKTALDTSDWPLLLKVCFFFKFIFC
jgi:hypothetical protein